MAVTDDIGISLGQTYSSRKGSRSPDRTVIWISPDGRFLQYDGAAVRFGRQYPSASAEDFAKWAGLPRLSPTAPKERTEENG